MAPKVAERLRRPLYARLVMGEVSVSDKEIRITGSKLVLARRAAAKVVSSAPGLSSCSHERQRGPHRRFHTIDIMSVRSEPASQPCESAAAENEGACSGGHRFPSEPI